MKQTTVCFLVRNSKELEVLLGLKKAGFGAGKYAGIGGKLEAGETIIEAAVREVEEEIGVKVPPENLEFMGTVTFLFPYRAAWCQEVSVFITYDWQGDPRESGEMKPRWFRLTDIPYHFMWQDASHWLPMVLHGTKIQSLFSFQEDCETVDEVYLSPLAVIEAAQ